MGLWIQILAGANEPIYMQIVSQISKAIAKELLTAGDKLPAVRKLAAELVVNPNTVAKAYTLLEKQKLVNTKTGAGTFVSQPDGLNVDPVNMNLLNERIDTIITDGINCGLKENELTKLFEKRLKKFGKKSVEGRK